MVSVSNNFALTGRDPNSKRDWWLNPGENGSFWVQPFASTATWTTSGSVITLLRNGSNSRPTAYVHVDTTNDFVVPMWIGVASDPLITITADNGKRIQVHIPVGAITEQPSTQFDSSIGGCDRAQPYLVWCASVARIHNANGSIAVQSSGTTITCSYLAVDDGAGKFMCDAVTGQPGTGNTYGTIQEWELKAAVDDPNYVIQHMLAYSLDPLQNNSQIAWPLLIADNSHANTGSVPQGSTLGIPASTVRPAGKTRGFNLLFDQAQQFGWFYYNVSENGCLSLGAYSTTSATAALAQDLHNSASDVMQYICILNNQTGLSTVKGMQPGGQNQYLAPPPLDLSPTGGVNVAPHTFGAWYPSGYDVTPNNVDPPLPVTNLVVYATTDPQYIGVIWDDPNV